MWAESSAKASDSKSRAPWDVDQWAHKSFSLWTDKRFVHKCLCPLSSSWTVIKKCGQKLQEKPGNPEPHETSVSEQAKAFFHRIYSCLDLRYHSFWIIFPSPHETSASEHAKAFFPKWNLCNLIVQFLDTHTKIHKCLCHWLMFSC